MIPTTMEKLYFTDEYAPSMRAVMSQQEKAVLPLSDHYDNRPSPKDLANMYVEQKDLYAHAACRGMQGKHFFPPNDVIEREAAKSDREAAAKAICASCVVIDACREFALKNNAGEGIVIAGMTSDELRDAQGLLPRRPRRRTK